MNFELLRERPSEWIGSLLQSMNHLLVGCIRTEDWLSIRDLILLCIFR
jgi:hypothetical protein